MDQIEANLKVVGWRAAGKVAGRAVSYLRRRCAEGSLHSNRDANGNHLFDRAELEALRPEPSSMTESSVDAPAPDTAVVDPTPELAASDTKPAVPAPTPAIPAPSTTPDPRLVFAIVFADLEAGKPLAQIVVDRGVTPEAVQHALEQWRKLKLLDVNAPSVPAKLSELEERVSQFKQNLDALALLQSELQRTVPGLTVVLTRTAALESWARDVPPRTAKLATASWNSLVTLSADVGDLRERVEKLETRRMVVEVLSQGVRTGTSDASTSNAVPSAEEAQQASTTATADTAERRP